MTCPVDGRELGSVLIDGADQQRDAELPGPEWVRVCSAECDNRIREDAGIEIRSKGDAGDGGTA